MVLQTNIKKVLFSYYAIAASDHGFEIVKVTAHKGKIIEKGPVIRNCKDQREAVAIVRGMNYGEEAA